MALFRFNASTGKLVPITSEGNIGLPVGAVQGFALGTQSPNWLLCDGRDTTGTEDELQTHYPALYTYLGNSNVLPDYRECVLVGVGQNDTDTIAEHDVYTLGEFKDDQLQNITATFRNGCVDHTLNTALRNLTGALKNGGTLPKTSYPNVAPSSSGNYHNDEQVKLDASLVARTGTTTHGKQKGVAYYIKATSAGIEVDRGLYATKGMLDLGPDYANGVTTQLSTTQGGTSTGVLTTTFAATEDCYFVARHYTLNAGSVNVSTSLLIYYGTDTTFGTEIYRASQPSVYGAGVANPPIRLSAGETITIVYIGYNDRGYCKNYTVYPVKRGN